MRLRWRRRNTEPSPEEHLSSTEDRLRYLEAVALGLRERDAVLAVLDEARSTEAAVRRVAERFGLDEVHAAVILDMQVRRFVPAEVARVEDELQWTREQHDRLLHERSQSR